MNELETPQRSERTYVGAGRGRRTVDRWEPRVVVLVLALLTAGFLWPLVSRPFSYLPDSSDTLHNIHAYRSIWRNIVDGRFLSFDGGIFYPTPHTLLFGELQVNNALLYRAFEALTGDSMAAYNLLLVAAFLGSALAIYLLLREVGVPSAVALFGAVASSFQCYRFTHLPHIQQLTVFWVILPILFLLRWARDGGWRNLAAFAVFSTAQLASPGYDTIILLGLEACILVGLGIFALYRRMRWRRWAAPIAVSAVGLVIVSPVWLAYLSLARHGYSRSVAEHLLYGLDLSYLWFSVPYDRLYGEFSQRFTMFRPDYTISPVFTGFAFPLAVMLLGFVGLREIRSSRVGLLHGVVGGALVLAGMVLVLLSFGPTLKLRDHSLALNPLFLAFRYVKVLDSVRYLPALYWSGAMSLVLGTSVWAGPALARWPRSRIWGWFGAATAVFVIENLVWLPTVAFAHGRPDRLPAVYRVLRDAPPGPLVELPLPDEIRAGRPAFERQFRDMYYETWHHHPLVGGTTGFFPPSFVTAIARLQTMPHFGGLIYLEKQGVRYIVVHAEPGEEARWNRYGHFLRGLYGDSEYLLYALKPGIGDWVMAAPTSFHGGSTGRIALDAIPIEVKAGNRFTMDVTIENTGSLIWLGNTQFADPPGRGEVRIVAHAWRRSDGLVPRDPHDPTARLNQRNPIGGDLFPTERRQVRVTALAPSEPGDYTFTIGLVSELVEWLPTPAQKELRIQVAP